MTERIDKEFEEKCLKEKIVTIKPTVTIIQEIHSLYQEQEFILPA